MSNEMPLGAYNISWLASPQMPIDPSGKVSRRVAASIAISAAAGYVAGVDVDGGLFPSESASGTKKASFKRVFQKDTFLPVLELFLCYDKVFYII